MFDVSEFKSTIGKRGLAKPNNFAVNITPPPQLSDSVITDLPLLVNSANLPGMNLNVDAIRYRGFGLSELRPIYVEFEQVTLTIIGDAQGQVLSFIQKWMSLVFNYDETSQRSSYQIPLETFNYPDEYVGTIDLHLYNIAGQTYTTYQLHRAYPTNIGAVMLNWAEQDGLMMISLSFAYRSFTTDATRSLSVTDSQINTLTGSNARNVEQLQKILTNPNLQEYQQRFQTT